MVKWRSWKGDRLQWLQLGMVVMARDDGKDVYGAGDGGGSGEGRWR